MKRCQISVFACDAQIVIWCDICKENVAWSADWFTEAEIVATAEGHRKVMARARKLASDVQTSRN